jgi:hypothetical protein
MGSLRIGLILATLPTIAGAGVCDTQYPDWDGTPATMLSEALAQFTSPLALILLVASALALRFRSQWGGLAVTLLWAGLVSMIAFFDPGGTRTQAMTEGCVGPATLFIAAVTAICTGIILYTAPRQRRD